MSELITASDKIEDACIDLIRHRLGISIHKHQKNDLHKTIVNACRIFQCTPESYLNMLISNPVESPVFEHLIAGITIGESYFFRDKNQMQLLQNTVLPTLIKEKRQEGNLSIRIWSAGCSSGEEIYTIAIMLTELLPDIEKWTLHLLGTDINTDSLKKAIAGHYKEWSMRSISDLVKKRYFEYTNKEYAIARKIKERVNFSYINLNETHLPLIVNETNAQDLIICRNVLIYFDEEHIAKLMKRFASSLVPHGYLLLGASDPIIMDDTKLNYHYRQGALFSYEPVEKIKNDSKKNAVPSQKSVIPIEPIKKPVEKIEKKSPTRLLLTEEYKRLIESFMTDSDWHKALNTIDGLLLQGIKNVFLLNTKATAYANLGKLQEAIELLKTSLILEPTNTLTYFTLAMALVELNKTKEAEEAFRKSIYLDHQFLVGHFQLGLLLLRNKQEKEGLKHLQNALNIAKRKGPVEEVPGFHGLQYSELANIFAHEIELHAGRNKQ